MKLNFMVCGVPACIRFVESCQPMDYLPTPFCRPPMRSAIGVACQSRTVDPRVAPIEQRIAIVNFAFALFSNRRVLAGVRVHVRVRVRAPPPSRIFCIVRFYSH